MAGDVKVNFISDTRAFVKDTDRMVEALEDNNEALKDLQKQGDRAGEKLEDSLRDAARAARDTEDDVRKIGKGFDKAGDGVKDFKQEANQSLKETAASISDVSDGLDAVQEIAANALSGFGPAGAAAGLAAAAGIGFVTAEFQRQQEEVDKLKERIASMYQSAAEEGRKYIDSAQITAEANNILFDPDRADDYKNALNDARALGLDINTVIRAMAGDQEAINVVLKRGNDLQADRKKLIEESDNPRAGLTQSAENRLLDEAIGRYTTINKLKDENAEKAQRSIDIENDLASDQSANAKRVQDAEAARFTALENKYRAAAGLPPITIPVNVQQPDLDAVRRDMQARFTAGGKRLTIVADVVDRYGRNVG